MSTFFGDSDKSVAFAMAAGAFLTISGTSVAICSTAMGSTDWKAVFGACCGAGLCLQSVSTAASIRKSQKAVQRFTLDRSIAIKDFVCSLLPDQHVLHEKDTSIDAFRNLLNDSTSKMQSALNEACFWNEIENYSKPFTKEQQYFAKMDKELYRQLKNLLSSKPSIESGSLVIEETDLLERIDELLLAHESKCLQGLATLEEEFKKNAQLAVYLENNEPNVDIKKDSPIREIVSEDKRDAAYFQSPKHLKKKVPKICPDSPTSKMYPDSPSSHRDIYFPKNSPRRTPKKTPKKSSTESPKAQPKAPPKSLKGSPKTPPKGSPLSPNGSPKKSPKNSPKTPPEGSPKSPKGSPKKSPNNSPKTPPKRSPISSNGSPKKSPKNSPQTPPKGSPESPNGSPKKSPKNSPKTPMKRSPISPNGSPKKSPKNSPSTPPKGSPKGSPKKSPKDSPKTPPKGSPKSPKGSPNKSPKESPKS